MKICLIRHGETDWNAIGMLQGREDIPLNENGKTQAKLCGLALKSMTWAAVITSPLQRARRTAEIIADALNIQEIYDDANLVERDYGKASGLVEKERTALFPDGKYEGMEDWETLRDRMYKSIIQNAGKFYPDNIIIVSHGSAINSILAELSNHEIGTGKTPLKNACINMFTYADGMLSIEFYNKAHDELLRDAGDGGIVVESLYDTRG